MENNELTPCQRLGYKVGDKFLVSYGSAPTANKGDIVALVEDDGTDTPFFTGSTLSHYRGHSVSLWLNWLQPIKAPDNNLVEEFHKAFGHPVETAPTLGTVELRILRTKLLIEEVLELATAFGLNVVCNVIDGVQHVAIEENKNLVPNVVEIADGLGDIRYVTDGANLCFGLPAEEILAEIHRSNMSKLGEDGKPIYREDGKVLKGPNYFEPDIAKIINKYSE